MMWPLLSKEFSEVALLQAVRHPGADHVVKMRLRPSAHKRLRQDKFYG
jgi:hypothetical protein